MAEGSKRRHIYVVSDATGSTGETVVRAALTQFQSSDVIVYRIPGVRTSQRVREVVEEASRTGGIIVYTMVSSECRQAMLAEGRQQNVDTIDLLGPLLTRLTDLLDISPLAQPGLFRQLDEAYFKRIAAVEFAVRHDDGKNSDELNQADIVLVGVSRTGKTPLSVYLAYRGWMVANVPIVPAINPPEALFRIDQHKIIGLTIRAERLQEIRSARIVTLGTQAAMYYASMDHIVNELKYCQQLCADRWPVIDVTHKSIEETATEVLTLLGRGGGLVSS